MRVVTMMELSIRCKMPYGQFHYLIKKGAILLNGKQIKARINLPVSGGCGFTIQEAAAIIKEVTGEDPRDFR